MVRVVNPPEYRGRVLRISFPGNSEPRAFWKAVGESIPIVIDKSHLLKQESYIDWRAVNRFIRVPGPIPPGSYQVGEIIE